MQIRWLIPLFLSCVPAFAQDDLEDEDLRQEFRAYKFPDYDAYQQSRGRLTDRIKVNGGLKYELFYDDSITGSGSGADEDFINLFMPSLSARYAYQNFGCSVNYRGKELVYTDHSEFNGMEHEGDAQIVYRTRRIQVKLYDNYFHRIQPSSSTLFDELVKRRQIDMGGVLRVDFNKVDFEVSAQRRTFEVFDDILDRFDHDRWDYYGRTLLVVGPRSKAFLEVGQNETEFEEAEFDAYRGRYGALGFIARIGTKVRLLAKFGRMDIDVDEASGTFGTEDQTDVLAQIDLTWRATQSSIYHLSAERKPVESLSAGWVIYTSIRMWWEQWVAERITGRLDLYWEGADQSEKAPDRDAWGGILAFKYELGRNFVLDAEVEYRYFRLEASGTTFTSTNASLGLGMYW